MKKKLLFIGAIILCFITNSQAQTLTVDALGSQQAGTTATMNFQYTSTTNCALYAELRIANISGTGVITQDYSSGSNFIVGKFSVLLPAQSTATASTLAFSIPGSVAPSSSLASGKTYSWVYKLTQGVSNYTDVGSTFKFTGATITAAAGVADNLTLVNPPTTTTQGSTVSITVNYTCPSARLIKFGISIYSSTGTFVSDLVAVGVDVSATSSTAVSLPQNLVIPSNATPSSLLPNGQYYKVDTALFTPAYGSYLLGSSSNITITTVPLSTTSFNENKVKLYPNPVSDFLNITTSLSLNSYEVYDVLGKVVLKASDTKSNQIDVSKLNKGIYLIKFDDKIVEKFIKK